MQCTAVFQKHHLFSRRHVFVSKSQAQISVSFWSEQIFCASFLSYLESIDNPKILQLTAGQITISFDLSAKKLFHCLIPVYIHLTSCEMKTHVQTVVPLFLHLMWNYLFRVMGTHEMLLKLMKASKVNMNCVYKMICSQKVDLACTSQNASRKLIVEVRCNLFNKFLHECKIQMYMKLLNRMSFGW